MMNTEMPGSFDETEKITPEQMLRMLFARLPDKTQDMLRTAAIPHWLDPALMEHLFPGEGKTTWAKIADYQFACESTPGRFDLENPPARLELHSLIRHMLIGDWQKQDPERFRRISAQISEELLRRVASCADGSWENMSEALYHALAADPVDGMRLTVGMFEQLLSSWQIGQAERLVQLAEEQLPWVGTEVDWMEYFRADLAFTNFRKLEEPTIDRLRNLAGAQNMSRLSASILRLLGRLEMRQQIWAAGWEDLQKSLTAGLTTQDLESQAQAHLALGDLYSQVVEASGGILVEKHTFNSPLHALLYVLRYGPLLLYQKLAERINRLPNFYGLNYQNWLAIHLLHKALDSYRAARDGFLVLKEQRGLVELESRMMRVLLVLGYPHKAYQLSQVSQQNPLIVWSPYDTARIDYIQAQVELLRRTSHPIDKRLSNDLKIFETYTDFAWVTTVAQALGEAYEIQGLFGCAADAYTRGIQAARNCDNLLVETELLRRVERLIKEYRANPALARDQGEDLANEKDLIQAADLLNHAARSAFIDRYPGPIRNAFQTLSNFLAYPAIFLFILLTIFASGFALQVVEGELRGNLPPVSAVDAVLLVLLLLLPLAMIWTYYLLYFLLGQLFIFSLSLSKVEKSQPDTYQVDDEGIRQTGVRGKQVRSLVWEDIQSVIIDRRALFHQPLVFSSRMILQGEGESLELPASIHCFDEMCAQIERKLENRKNPVKKTVIQISLLRAPWLFISLGLGLMIATALVTGLLGASVYGCYAPGGNIAEECPLNNRLYFQPWIQLVLIISSLFFVAASGIRWLKANQLVGRAQLRQEQRERNEK
jgi:hypothetical protein